MSKNTLAITLGFIQLFSPASGDPLILNPYTAWSLEAVSGHLLKMPMFSFF